MTLWLTSQQILPQIPDPYLKYGQHLVNTLCSDTEELIPHPSFPFLFLHISFIYPCCSFGMRSYPLPLHTQVRTCLMFCMKCFAAISDQRGPLEYCQQHLSKTMEICFGHLSCLKLSQMDYRGLCGKACLKVSLPIWLTSQVKRAKKKSNTCTCMPLRSAEAALCIPVDGLHRWFGVCLLLRVHRRRCHEQSMQSSTTQIRAAFVPSELQ